jgi:hypothetical protein
MTELGYEPYKAPEPKKKAPKKTETKVSEETPEK